MSIYLLYASFVKEFLTNVRFCVFNTIHTICVLRLCDFTQHISCIIAKY